MRVRDRGAAFLVATEEEPEAEAAEGEKVDDTDEVNETDKEETAIRAEETESAALLVSENTELPISDTFAGGKAVADRNDDAGASDGDSETGRRASEAEAVHAEGGADGEIESESGVGAEVVAGGGTIGGTGAEAQAT